MKIFKKGDIVLYSPYLRPGDPKFGGVVSEEPWQPEYGDLKPVTHVTGLGREYRSFTGRPDKETARDVPLRKLELAPTLLCSDGVWRSDAGADSAALRADIVGSVSWSKEKGWLFAICDADDAWSDWMLAESYEAARAAVEEACK